MNDAFRTYFELAASTAAVIHLVVLGLMTAAALHWRPSRNVRRFLQVALAIGLLAAVLPAIGASDLRAAMAEAVWILGVVGVYAAVLAMLVARAKGGWVLLGGAVALLLLTPLSILLGRAMACGLAGTCV